MRSRPAPTKKVLIYKADLLHFSETFIREQVLAYAQWTAMLVGMRRVPGLPLDGLDVHLLGRAEESAMVAAYGRVLKRFNLPHPRFVRELQSEGAALAHIHFGTEAVEFWPIARRLHLPVIVTLHGYDITVHKETWERGAAGASKAHYPHRLIAMSKSPRTYFIAVSKAIRQCAIDFGIPAERICVQYIGIDRTLFKPGGLPIVQRRRRILYVGRLVEKKGVGVLIDAYARVCGRVPDAELVIVGDGPLRQQLEALARRLSVPVVFAGSMGREEVKQQLDAARVFCLPSITAENGDAEGFGLVLLEAQACGVPVVTSAQGGAHEGIIDGVTGLSFAEKDVGVLTQQLVTLLTDDDCIVRMSQAGPRFVADNFDVRDCTRSLERLYDDVVGMAA